MGSGGDDLPAVDSVVDMWLAYPHWEVASELFRVVKSYLVTVIVASYDCEFVDPVSTFSQYFLPDMKTRMPVFYKACQNALYGIINAVIRDLSGRRALVCSTPFDPHFMKFGLRSSLKLSLELWCRSLTLRHFLVGGRAVDVH